MSVYVVLVSRYGDIVEHRTFTTASDVLDFALEVAASPDVWYRKIASIHGVDAEGNTRAFEIHEDRGKVVLAVVGA